jgi:hypothetical protein
MPFDDDDVFESNVRFKLSIHICGRNIDFVVHTVVANGFPLLNVESKTSQLRERLIRYAAIIDDEQLFLRLFGTSNSNSHSRLDVDVDAVAAWKFAKANAHSLEKSVVDKANSQ